jgi:hypothetical protein
MAGNEDYNSCTTSSYALHVQNVITAKATHKTLQSSSAAHYLLHLSMAAEVAVTCDGHPVCACAPVQQHRRMHRMHDTCLR